MSTSTYTPRADSLPARVLAFFQRNPEEELSLEDITDKFNTTRGNIHTNLGLAVEAGMLVRIRNGDGEYIYKAGKGLPKSAGVDMDAVHKRDPLANAFGAPPQTRRVATAADLPDPLAVQIRDDVPVPCRGGRARVDWLPLVKRLAKPGQSASLPIKAKFMLAAAITQAHKEKLGQFTLRTDKEAQTVTVWRTA